MKSLSFSEPCYGCPRSACSPCLRLAARKRRLPPHWGYSGADDPETLGTLDKAYAECSMGHAQSPINIATPRRPTFRRFGWTTNLRL